MRVLKRSAFTLIEMIVVIVILGIVAMIATDIIARMYDGYLRSKIINNLQQRTELALDQITKRLQFRIKDSAIAKNVSIPSQLKMLSDSNGSGNFNMLEWIGYDYEGFLGEYDTTLNRYTPGWSGFVDVYNTTDSTKDQISTPGSTLSAAERTIGALSNGDVNLSFGPQYPALIFKGSDTLTASFYGLDPSLPNDHNKTLRVRRNGEDILEFTEDTNEKRIYEQYYLAWSAYAIVPDVNPLTSKDDDFNLTLHYNYQPWHGETFNDGSKSVLAEHVSTFRFTQEGTAIRIKLCIQDGNQTGTPIGFCKEKAVF